MSELLPCPFCGGEDLEIDHAPTYIPERPDVYNVHCCECGANGSEEWTEKIAVAAWNTRAQTVFGMTLDEVRQMMKRYTEYERTSIPATEENMAKYGWVRDRTCENISEPPTGFYCSSCHWGDFCEPSHLLTTAKFTGRDNGGPNYCPNCGSRIIGGNE